MPTNQPQDIENTDNLPEGPPVSLGVGDDIKQIADLPPDSGQTASYIQDGELNQTNGLPDTSYLTDVSGLNDSTLNLDNATTEGLPQDDTQFASFNTFSNNTYDLGNTLGLAPPSNPLAQVAQQSTTPTTPNANTNTTPTNLLSNLLQNQNNNSPFSNNLYANNTTNTNTQNNNPSGTTHFLNQNLAEFGSDTNNLNNLAFLENQALAALDTTTYTFGAAQEEHPADLLKTTYIGNDLDNTLIFNSAIFDEFPKTLFFEAVEGDDAVKLLDFTSTVFVISKTPDDEVTIHFNVVNDFTNNTVSDAVDAADIDPVSISSEDLEITEFETGIDFNFINTTDIPDGESYNVTLGSADADIITGFGEGSILGLGGNDEIEGSDEAEVLIGGPGNDLILGGGGPDQLLGGPGDDVLNSGNDDADDIFFFDEDFGMDVIISDNSGTGDDTLFFKGYKADEIVAEAENFGADLLLSVNGNSVSIPDFFDGGGDAQSDVTKIAFGDDVTNTVPLSSLTVDVNGVLVDNGNIFV
jgi:hypothetical protein